MDRPYRAALPRRPPAPSSTPAAGRQFDSSLVDAFFAVLDSDAVLDIPLGALGRDDR